MKNHVKEIYRDLNNSKKLEIIESNWSRTGGKDKKSPLHSVASYLAMFAPALPEYFIDLYSKEGDLIFDPFSGRGTTALRSRELNRKFVGFDLNPYAFVLSKFKISKLNKKELLDKLKVLEKEFKLKQIFFYLKTCQKKYIELLNYYHRKTLSMLIFLREKIGKNWNNNNVINNGILAFSLGLMHGRSKKDGTTIYFSVSKPNTISMSPNYVKNYVKKHNLKKINVNIFEKIKNRIDNKYDKLLNKKYDGKIYLHDATKVNKNIKNNSIDLLVSSPPYLSIVNYTNSNWLKLWLLGYERKELKEKIKLSDNLKFNEYIIFLKNFLNSVHPKLKKGAKACLVVGDVYEEKIIEDVWNIIKDKVKYKFIELYYDVSYLQTRKVTNMLNDKKGKAIRIEKVLVLEKA